ncbi:MAG: LPS-assembly protein LptD [Nitrospiraceae bacterium]|nr:MAG: LPS-assembly protein LptD [Nitrospiraceae bacterium]
MQRERDRYYRTMPTLMRTLLLTLVILCPLSLPSHALADEPLSITADHLEYITESNTYRALGSVTVTVGDASLSADEMRMNSISYDAVAEGNVIFRDPDATITAERMELNLKTKQGTVYNSYTFYKKHNFHLRSSEVTKTGEKSFFIKETTITTCDAEPPEWYISAQDVTLKEGQTITGRKGSFNIRNVPVFYAPYFWAPLNRDRQTGFLFPTFGYSSKRGYYYKQGFFWAIEDNQDATVYVDYYSKKGLAEGLDYRYVLSDKANGEMWLYHGRDKQPSRDLYEFKSYHNQDLPYDMEAYAKIHAVSHFDYYETLSSTSQDRFGLESWDTSQFGFASEEKLQKYLESDVQVSKPFSGGRAYLLAQGRQSLEGSSEEIPQPLPEIALVLNTRTQKFFSYDISLKGNNFWREEGQEGRRVDIYPNVYLSFGRLITLTQKVGLRETVYFLEKPGGYEDRFIYDLDTTVTTTFLKRYASFIHSIEPAVSYIYIPDVDQEEIPFFDSTDFVPQTRSLVYALTNRISGMGDRHFEARFRLSQSYSFLDSEEPFSPVLAEATISSRSLSLRMNASYDTDDNILGEFFGTVRLKGERGYVGVGKNLRRSSDLDQYTFEAAAYSPIRLNGISIPVEFRGKLWYDAKNSRIQELNVVTAYRKQCWGFSVTYNEEPDEYQIIFAVEFTGLGTFSLGSI